MVLYSSRGVTHCMKKQLVHIKGTKDGLVLKMDDQCAYEELVEELKHKVSDGGVEGKVEVQLHLGYRYCHDEQIKELIKIIQQSGQMLVSKIQCDVLTVEESNRKLIEKDCDTYVGVVRSGQVLQACGDIVIVGNVNPNARVEASGSIYVLGKLKGIAHAGKNGNKQAVVAASFLEATHVMIADQLETMSNEHLSTKGNSMLTCAFINENGRISYDHIHALRNIRPEFITSKGGS